MVRFARGYVGRQSLIVGIPGFGGPKGYMNRGSRDRLYTGEFIGGRLVDGGFRGVWRRTDAGPTGGHDSYSALVLAENPLLYWRLGEGDGTVLQDSSTNDRDGTLGGGRLGVQGGLLGDSDTAVDLDGVDDYVSNNTWSPNGPFTNGSQRTFVGLWWRDTEAALMTLWAGADSGNAAPIFYLGDGTTHPASRVLFAPNGNAGGTVQWDSAYPGTGRWVHVALEFDEPADTATLYINGDSKGTVAVPTAWGPSATTFFLLLGAWYAGGGFFFFDGKADEYSIHDGLLGQQKIARLYRASRAAGSQVGAQDIGGEHRVGGGVIEIGVTGSPLKAVARKSDAGPIAGDPAFPVTGVLDDFNRADGGLGANWSEIFSGEANPVIVTNQVEGPTNGFSSAGWNVTRFAADQETHLTVVDPGPILYLFVRAQALDQANPDVYSMFANPSTGKLTFERFGTYASLGESAAMVGYGAGSQLGLRMIGTRLEGWHKPSGGQWTLMHAVTDAGIQGSGYVGFDLGRSGAVKAVIDNFAGGDVKVLGSQVGGDKRMDRIDRNGPVSDRLAGQQDLDVQARVGAGTIRDGILGGPWYAWVRVQGGPVSDRATGGPGKLEVRKADAGPVRDMVAQGFVKAEARPGVLIVRDDHLSGDVTAYAAAIEGITRDCAGTAIGSVTVWLFRSNGPEDRLFITETTSDASGNYRVIDLSTSGNHFVYCHKADSPHIFGASDKELTVQLTQIFP